jgi:shikimate O-hydroxycinnamoyltransferase
LVAPCWGVAQAKGLAGLTPAPALILTPLEAIPETLTRFYPLAGSLVDASTIDCNDDGGYFVEERCDSPLSDFLSKPNYETLD